MNAVVAVIGRDNIGILAKVAEACAKYNGNIVDVSQTVMSGMFAMIMNINIDNLSVELSDFASKMHEYGTLNNLEINVMHENIFNSMHKI